MKTFTVSADQKEAMEKQMALLTVTLALGVVSLVLLVAANAVLEGRAIEGLAVSPAEPTTN